MKDRAWLDKYNAVVRERDDLRDQLARVQAWVTQHTRILDDRMIRRSIEAILTDTV